MEINFEHEINDLYNRDQPHEIQEIYHHPNCFYYTGFNQLNEGEPTYEAYENYSQLRNTLQSDMKVNSNIQQTLTEFKCGCTMRSESQDKVDLNLYSNLYDLERDNTKLSGNLEFALELLDLVLGYINHYFNIIFGTDKNIPLNKFKINEVRDVLEKIEERLFSLSKAEAELFLIKNKQDSFQSYQDSTNFLNRTLSTNAMSKDNLKFNKEDNAKRIADLELQLKDLLAQNANLNNTIEDLSKKLEAKKKKVKTIKRFESKGLNGQTAFSFEILPEDSYTVFEDISVNRKGSELSTLTKKSKMSRKRLGKFKVIESGNLYDKYSNKKTDSYISGHWAMDGYESVVKKEGKLTKVLKALVTDKLDLDKKQIIPVKPLNYSHILNKQNDGSKMGSSMTVRTVKFQDSNEANEVEKHKFD